MDTAYVLLHSPTVGPSTWAPVAGRLPGAVVPSLLRVGDAGPPFWPAVVEAVTAEIDRLPAGTRVVLVAHSNAGRFVPVLAEHAAACVFVDAALPGQAGPAPEFLRAMTGLDGRLPRWTDWWDEADVAPLFPDETTRRTVEAEQPRLPPAYFEQPVPVPPGWDTMPCAYLLFSGRAYAAEAAGARARGWRVDHLPGLHLHQLVDPAGVAARIEEMSHSG
ncbi:alpha/beta hydrolase [Actinoplanes sp. G11-F43]|uniref:alpha/beta hydrolase n=1 Tax=Actinoplanes sp. G11-F43 TaxID=3424130 RepID=UPI003D32F19D